MQNLKSSMIFCLNMLELWTKHKGLGWLFSAAAECFLYDTTKSPMNSDIRIHENSVHMYMWIHSRNQSYNTFEFIKTNSYCIFHYWIQWNEFSLRILTSPWFSGMNSYHEFMFMKSDSWIQIWYYEKKIVWILLSEFIFSWNHVWI